MKIFTETCIFSLVCILLFPGHQVQAFDYNYSSTTECLAEPWRAQYGGGIIFNPEFNLNTEGWLVCGNAAIGEDVSKNGNKFIVVHNRTDPLDSITRKVQLEKGKHYSFSAWIQVSKGSETVTVSFSTSNGRLLSGGKVLAKQGCWSLLKGGIYADFSSHAHVLFESKNPEVDIWIDNVSLQPFTKEKWRVHQEKSIEKARKSRLRLQVTYANKTVVKGARISIKQVKSDFPFGCGMNHHILESSGYQDWFASRFKYATFTNEMKWYSTEKKQGQENYTIADSMLDFTKQHGISVRGHNILWDNPKQQPSWVKNLSPEELRNATEMRIHSVVSRYAGQVIAWDVVNENLHFSFFEDKLGQNASAEFYAAAYKLDHNAIMFLNEYNTIEYPDDQASSPENYKKKAHEILSYPGTAGMRAGIGCQGHFGASQPNLAYMRSSLDTLATMGLPIWLTEVDVDKNPDQANYLEEILREGYSHPAVEGIIIFGGPQVSGFSPLSLADENFKNTAAGDVVDKLISEWKTNKSLVVATNDEGISEISLFHGDYNITVENLVANSSITTSFKVARDKPLETLHINVNV